MQSYMAADPLLADQIARSDVLAEPGVFSLSHVVLRSLSSLSRLSSFTAFHGFPSHGQIFLVSQ